MYLHRLNGLAVLVTASVLAACGTDDSEKKASQVVAKVAGEEITVYQLNYAMSRTGVTAQSGDNLAAQKKVLDALVDQQLLVKQAIEQKLDRDPTVVQAIETTKRAMLAEAYIERRLPQREKPSPAEVKDYFQKHPELFEKRRLFRLGEVRVTVAADKFDAVQSELKQAKGLSEFVDWLKTEKFAYTTSGGVKPAEELPLEWVPKLIAMKDGDNLVMQEPASMRVIQLLGSQEQAVTETQATPVIERFLMNQRRVDFEREEIKKLRAAAKIEFVGPFAGGGTTAAQTMPAPATPAGQPGFMDKGLSGLK